MLARMICKYAIDFCEGMVAHGGACFGLQGRVASLL